jgi:pimeloyl-ACP methyl ester carboxylesterase
MMEHVISKDGTRITYDRLGQGAAVILVSGGSVDKSSNAGLAELLAAQFTVFNYDRRGRGASGDTLPYAVEREVEDIDAVIEAAGGSAYLFGSSSGAALALEAARQLPSRISKLVLWEPPFNPTNRPPADTARIFSDLVAEGKRGEAAEFFMTQVVGLPPDFVGFARSQPWWAQQEALAHTLAYDATIMGDYSLPTERAAQVMMPTLVLAGGASFPFMMDTAQTLGRIMPQARVQFLEGQEHNVAADVLAAAMIEFLKGS